MEEILSVILINYNSSEFVEVALSGLHELTLNLFKVLLCDNGSLEADRKNLERIARKFSNVELILRQQTESGSMGHGEALNLMMEKVDTPYGVILDADATFLIKHWDKILINELDDKVKIIGTQPVPGTSKPSDFPLMFAILFETKTFKELEIDMRPADIANGKDTGWEMREKFKAAQYEAKLLYFKNTRHFKEGPFKDILCAEFYHPDHEQIFASHFGRGSTLGLSKFKERNFLLEYFGLSNFFKRLRGLREKKTWIKTCHTIIKQQKRR